MRSLYWKRLSVLIGTGLLIGIVLMLCNFQVFGAGVSQLQVVGNKLCDSSGNPVALHGMSLFWSNWDPGLFNGSVVKWLKDDWKCTVVRAPMGIEPTGAYLSNPDAQKQKVMAVVDAAINQGMYVIIDWHDHNAQNHTQQAKEFFASMAQKYGSYPNVLYEIYNEPQSTPWSTIKTYAEEVIGAIRQYDPDNIIIVGTPTWSQDVDAAADNPIQKSNIVYALHFYAATHKQWLRDKATYALNKGIALFVSEWGSCDASGAGTIDYTESDTWIAFMKNNNLSWCNWSINTKAETASALNSSANLSGNWRDSDLTAAGQYVRGQLISLAKVVPSASPTVIPSPTPTITNAPTITPQQSPSLTSSPNPGTGCVVTYSKNDWGNGATVSITIKNNGSAAITNWELVFSFAGNQKIGNLWGGKYTQSGATVTVTNESYNATIPVGGAVEFGFNLNYSGSNVKPASFTLNGTTCTTN